MSKHIVCDLCQNEITERVGVVDSFNSKEGLLISITISSPKSADLCKSCIIDIIQNGKVVSTIERYREEHQND